MAIRWSSCDWSGRRRSVCSAPPSAATGVACSARWPTRTPCRVAAVCLHRSLRARPRSHVSCRGVSAPQRVCLSAPASAAFVPGEIYSPRERPGRRVREWLYEAVWQRERARQKVRQESAREERENGRKSEIFLQFSLRFLPARYALRDCRCEGDGRHVAAARDTRQSGRWIAAGLATVCAQLLSAAAIAQTAGLASQHVGLAFCRVVPWLSELLDVFCQDRLRTAKLVFKGRLRTADLPRGC